MNKKVLMILIVLITFAYPVLGAGTDFSVTVADGQTALNFSTHKTATGVEPVGQSVATPTPWAIIQNLGDGDQTFKIKFGGTNPTGITLYVASTPDFGDQIQVPRSTSTAQAPGGWNAVAPGATIDAYFKIDTVGTAVSGTNTLQVT